MTAIRRQPSPPLPILDAGGLSYRCPGEAYEIPRAVHLGRLAANYHACQECPHRAETGLLSRRRGRQLTRLNARRASGSPFGAESFDADFINQVSTSDVRRMAQTFGIWLRAAGNRPAGEVMLASDGGVLVPELIAALAEGLRWADLTVVDAGVATAASLGLAQQQLSATGAILLATHRSPAFRIRLRFWGPGGTPLSRPGALDELSAVHAGTLSRPTRRFAKVRYEAIDARYLATLADYFHALRPLRFLSDCPSEPFVQQLKKLLANVGCEMLPAAGLFDRSIGELLSQLRTNSAHFAVSITEDDCLQIWDDRGRRASAEQVWPVLLRQLLPQSCPKPTKSPNVVLGRDCRQIDAGHVVPATKIFRAEESPQSMHAAMLGRRALLGCESRGRYWFRVGAATLCDPLRALALFLVAASQSDQPIAKLLPALASE